MNAPQVVSPEEWEAAWQEMLVKEKAHTRARDALAADRRPGDRRQRLEVAAPADEREQGPHATTVWYSSPSG